MDTPMFSIEDFKYLCGEKFATRRKFAYSSPAGKETRIGYILSKSKGKKVIHLGFADHNAEVITEKIEKGNWLHKNICEVSTRCIGIDINEEATEFVKDHYKISDIYAGDIFTDDFPALFEEEWDYIILGEILEHVDDPVSFLTRLKGRIGPIAGKIIITVPNAFHYKNFRNAWKGTEAINTDHRYWFTPFTLAKVMTRANISIDEIVCTQDNSFKTVHNFSWYIRRFHPMLRSRIVACGTFN